MATRRGFLATALAAAALPRLTWADAGNPSFLGAAREPDGGYALFGLDMAGDELFRVPLPARGHAAAAHPTAPEAVAFARRPGRFAVVVDCATGAVKARLESPAGRHFMGHGEFLADGDTLCTPENDFDSGTGKIGLWSRREGYARIGEFASHGIGPHDIKLMADGTLVVANGGILTHPDRGEGREKLNLDTMRPNLAYFTQAGELLERHELAPELHLNSIRHLALREDGLVAFAMQWQGDVTQPWPLIGLHRRGGTPRLLEADLAEQVAMQGYAGSIAFSGDGQSVGITSPRGGRLHAFAADDGRFLGATRRADICGLAAAPGGFLASDGLGGLCRMGGASAEAVTPLGSFSRAWDNHLVAVL